MTQRSEKEIPTDKKKKQFQQKQKGKSVGTRVYRIILMVGFTEVNI